MSSLNAAMAVVVVVGTYFFYEYMAFDCPLVLIDILKRFAMHAIIIFLNYSSKILNCTLNFKSLSSRFLNKLVLLANYSAAGKLFQLVITLLLNVGLPILE